MRVLPASFAQEQLWLIDQMQPRAIGIDILIDQRQPEDPELIGTLREMRTPTFLAFASSNPEYGNPDQMEYWQEQFLRGFLAQVQPGPVRPASIKTEPDLADGVSWAIEQGVADPARVCIAGSDYGKGDQQVQAEAGFVSGFGGIGH